MLIASLPLLFLLALLTAAPVKPATNPAATAPTAASAPATPQPAWPSDEPLLVSEAGSERATTGPGNNIVTRDGRTHMVWQESDAKGYYDVARTLDRKTGQWSPIYRIGPAKDNHARPALAIDSKGYLHVVIGGHVTMMTYFKSKRPNDASEWERPKAVGIGTYPMLICGAGDVLVLAARHDIEPRGLNLFVNNGDGRWHLRENIFQRRADHPGYSGFNAALAWGPEGTRLHLAIDSYESGRTADKRGIYQSIAYMVSDDLGKTWTKSDGTPIGEKPTTDKLDIIAEFEEPQAKSPPVSLRNGGMVVDEKGQPIIYFAQRTPTAWLARLVTPSAQEKSKWRDLPLDQAYRKAWPNSQPSGARGSLSMTADGAMHVLFMINPDKDDDDRPDGDEEKFAGNYGVGMLSSPDGGQSFSARTLLPYDRARRVNLSNIERQTGHNDLQTRLPSVLWMDGMQRYPKPGEVINTKVFWMQP